ncbi:MAG: short-chain dehydrogenase/reductase [Hyphomicrobiales bacterium]|nr:short-chain dehydrogenase/reductase [Hyphomicrobiales bacterium]
MQGSDGNERNALITGAARRIGRAVAERLAAEGYGLALHASERSAPAAEELAGTIRRRGGRACVVVADLASPEDTATLVDRALAAIGPLCLLVNNASIYEPDAADVFDAARWDQHMAVNLRAPVQLAAAFAASIPPRGEGVVINITDQKVWRLNPRFFSYTLSKAALWTATQTMAQAFAPRVRVNAIGPGPVLPNHLEGPEGFEREAAALPLGASVAPEEIAAAVLFLTQARSVTGQMIAVDGGQHLSWKTPDISG